MKELGRNIMVADELKSLLDTIPSDATINIQGWASSMMTENKIPVNTHISRVYWDEENYEVILKF